MEHITYSFRFQNPPLQNDTKMLDWIDDPLLSDLQKVTLYRWAYVGDLRAITLQMVDPYITWPSNRWPSDDLLLRMITF